MIRIFILSAFLAVVPGCGGGPAGGQPVYPVTGTVTMFGAPLAKATVAFAPQGNQPTAIGTTDTQGNFTLTTYDFGDGAAEGSYKVVISKASAAASSGPASVEGGEGANHGVDPASVPSSHGTGESGADDSTTMVPQQYTSSTDTPLKADVKSDGENAFTFEIK